MEPNHGSASISKNLDFGRIFSAVLVSGVFFSALVHAAPIKVAKAFSEVEAQLVEIDPEVAFMSDRKKLCSAPGKERNAGIQPPDSAAELIADPTLGGSSGDGAILSAGSLLRGEAQLQSEETWMGSLISRATVTQLGITIAGQTTKTDLRSGISLTSSNWRPSHWILKTFGGQLTERTVVPMSNAKSENPGAKDLAWRKCAICLHIPTTDSSIEVPLLARQKHIDPTEFGV